MYVDYFSGFTAKHVHQTQLLLLMGSQTYRIVFHVDSSPATALRSSGCALDHVTLRPAGNLRRNEMHALQLIVQRLARDRDLPVYSYNSRARTGLSYSNSQGGSSCRAWRVNAPKSPDFDARGREMVLPSHFSMASLPIVRLNFGEN